MLFLLKFGEKTSNLVLFPNSPCFMSKSHLMDKVRSQKEIFTPWFKLIIDNKINDLFLLFSNNKEDQEIKITNYIE